MGQVIKRVAIAALVMTLGACTAEERRLEPPAVEGPPRFEVAAAVNQAAQFDEEIPERAAGSAEEQGAAAYILGTLQRNGYVARLDAVPVADTARSTNVIGRPFGGDTAAMVVVPYGTGPGAPNASLALGTFLELARALTAAEPGHAVSFTAVGAEFTGVGGGHLGSRRLARFLMDEEERPLIVQLGTIAEGEPLAVGGDANDVLFGSLGEGERREAPLPDPDVFSDAGLSRIVVSGAPDEVGELLLGFLVNLGL